jgi:hypothetical protein
MDRTLVTFLLDRTGSMLSCKQATIEAFNGYLEGLKQGPEAKFIEFTFLQFDSVSLDKICVAEDIQGVQPLTESSYEPRASTPLVDAAYKTIKAIEASLTKRDDKPKIVVCIQTDGFENASTEHTMAELNALIKEKTAQGWQFIFMGAGIDAYAQSAMMGISAQSTGSYNKASPQATRSMFVSASANTKAFSSGATPDASFNMGQRHLSQDIHADKYLDKDGNAKAAPDLTVGVPIAAPRQPTPAPTRREPPIVDDVTL